MKEAAFFDMDGTVLNCESQMRFAFWCMIRGVIPLHLVAGLLARYTVYVCGFTDDATALRRAGFKLMAGFSVERIELLARDYFCRYLRRRIRPAARLVVRRHKDTGCPVVLITAAMYQLAAPVASELGIDEVIATRLEQQNGILTGDCVKPEPYREGKRTHIEAYSIRSGVGLNQCFAYADHVSDAPMLESVGMPTAINPTKALSRLARERNWPIENWNVEGHA